MRAPSQSILKLVLIEAGDERHRLAISAIFAGFASTLIMHLVGTFAAAPRVANFRTFLMFVVAIGVYAHGTRHVYHRVEDLIEAILYQLRVRIVRKIQRAELEGIEKLETAEIYSRVTESVGIISVSAGMLSRMVQSVIVTTTCAIYLALLSYTTFLALFLFLTPGLLLYGIGFAAARGHFKTMAQTRIAFLDSLADLLKGFKEVKHNHKRNTELGEDIVSEAKTLQETTSRANHLFDDNWVFVNCVLYAALGALVMILPQYDVLTADTLDQVVPVVLFIWGPFLGIMRTYPEYLRSNQALDEIKALEEKLESAIHKHSSKEHNEPAWQGPLTSIEARNLEYQYPMAKNDEGFRIGPLNLTIAGGEIIFIVGGNGSGKSTLIKTLTGLYPPTQGTLSVNGVLVQPKNAAAYRELSSAIYSDFHLFKKLYGLLNVDEAAVKQLLVDMQLNGKTDFRNHAFTKRDLSTGQRKRLAMIILLLEDRPLYVFDEWAADQDPDFRHHFYIEMLPAFKQRGKTVIAACHDDRYFHCADKVVTMEYGQIRAIERHAHRSGETSV